MSLAVVRVLGWVVVAHGLSHAVLPLRGSIEPAVLVDDWTPVVLYGVAMVGFVAAGLGLLGMRPFDAAISPLLVLASGLSLVAIVRFSDPSLWFGGVCDVALLLLGLWRAYGGWPAHPPHGRLWHAVALAAGFALLVYVAAASFLYPWHRTWGSTRDELALALPGDAPERSRGVEIQHAVTIDAQPDVVWSWLVQLGQDRAGFYSYDWLERAFGAQVRNVHERRAPWQSLHAGDFVRATQPGYLGIFNEPLGWRVTRAEPGRVLVLENWGAFVLLPAGDHQTRFIIRSTISDRHIPVWASALNLVTFQLPHFIMQRRMMLTIKELSEQGDALRTAARRSRR
jgi:hypothetical protein